MVLMVTITTTIIARHRHYFTSASQTSGGKSGIITLHIRRRKLEPQRGSVTSSRSHSSEVVEPGSAVNPMVFTKTWPKYGHLQGTERGIQLCTHRLNPHPEASPRIFPISASSHSKAVLAKEKGWLSSWYTYYLSRSRITCNEKGLNSTSGKAITQGWASPGSI